MGGGVHVGHVPRVLLQIESPRHVPLLQHAVLIGQLDFLGRLAAG